MKLRGKPGTEVIGFPEMMKAATIASQRCAVTPDEEVVIAAPPLDLMATQDDRAR